MNYTRLTNAVTNTARKPVESANALQWAWSLAITAMLVVAIVAILCG